MKMRTVSDSARAKLAKLVQASSIDAVAAKIGCDRKTLLSAAIGAPVRPMTAAALEAFAEKNGGAK